VKNVFLFFLATFLNLTFSYAQYFPDDFFFDDFKTTDEPYDYPIASYSVWTMIQSKDSLSYQLKNDCLSQLLDQPSLTQIKNIRLLRQNDNMLLIFDKKDPRAKTNIKFTKLNKGCAQNYCSLIPDPKNNLFFLRSVQLEGGHSRQFKLELIPQKIGNWHLKTTHQIKIFGLIPAGENSKTCQLREILL
jgi:hypothetical protein